MQPYCTTRAITVSALRRTSSLSKSRFQNRPCIRRGIRSTPFIIVAAAGPLSLDGERVRVNADQIGGRSRESVGVVRVCEKDQSAASGGAMSTTFDEALRDVLA